MKFNILFLVLVVACARPSDSSKKNSSGPNNIDTPAPIEEIADPLVPGEQQQQTDQEFELERTYSGVNVVLNYNSSRSLGMIRIKDKDAEKLHKLMALSSIKIEAPGVKSDLEAKVGKHVMCRPEICWIYVDYKNGDVNENIRVSEKAKAATLGLNHRGPNLELSRVMPDLFKIFHKGVIKVSGMDAKALYSVMAIPETAAGGKGSPSSRKAGEGISCLKKPVKEQKENQDANTYECEVQFDFRTGELRDLSV